MHSKDHTDMKKNILNTWLLAALACLSFVACTDEPYKYEATAGKPEIFYIRPAGVAKDTLLTDAYMGSGLCIIGNNLRSTYKVFFNDQEAILNTSYITDNTMLLDVPNTIPGEVSNTIYFITKDADTTKFAFQVLVPGPVINNMDCEWLPAGATATLAGDYFIDDPNVPLTVTFDGGIKAEVRNISKNILSFVIPEGAKEGPITVKTIYGEAASSFYYKDSRGMLFDFDTDPRLRCHGWHNEHFIGTDETSLSGNYLQLGDPTVTMTATGGWDDTHYAFEYWPGDWTDPVSYNDSPLLTDVADFSDWENLLFKFELNIPAANGWAAGMLQIIPAGLDKISGSGAGVDIYGNTVAGANNNFFKSFDDGGSNVRRGLYQPWTTADDGIYHTDSQWITVSIPLKNFIYGIDGTESTAPKLTPESFTSLTLFILGGKEGKECNPVFKFDNIRVVPAK